MRQNWRVRRAQKSPLPRRNGLEPACLRLPPDGEWLTLREHLIDRLPRVTEARIDEMLSGGRIVNREGPLGPDAPYVPGSHIWFHRDLPVEVPVPFEIGIVHRDEDILVVDKPHFLSTIPRGRHVMQSALVRLRNDLDLPELSPAHRLDRSTAGLLLFVIKPQLRGAYQRLFAERRITKVYEAIAPYVPSLDLPRTITSRIIKERGILAAFEEPGEPNAVTQVELIEHRNGLGRYQLRPETGRTHQLRLHMNSLGIPILGDQFYPVITERPVEDFTNPLQLLAKSLAFIDPITEQPRSFQTKLSLETWT